MKELFLALLDAANKLNPMRGVHTSWCTAGSFTYYREGAATAIISFIIEGNRGTFRRVDVKDSENEWFDVIKTVGGTHKYLAIIHNGIKYNLQPTLQL